MPLVLFFVTCCLRGLAFNAPNQRVACGFLTISKGSWHSRRQPINIYSKRSSRISSSLLPSTDTREKAALLYSKPIVAKSFAAMVGFIVGDLLTQLTKVCSLTLSHR